MEKQTFRIDVKTLEDQYLISIFEINNDLKPIPRTDIRNFVKIICLIAKIEYNSNFTVEDQYWIKIPR